jgi:hypothetical protein
MSTLRKNVIRMTVGSVTAMVLLFIFMSVVNPTGRPLYILIVPIVLAWTALYLLLRLLFVLFLRRDSKIQKVLLLAISSALILLLMLSGIGELKTIDIVLVLLLSVVSTVYFYRTWS